MELVAQILKAATTRVPSTLVAVRKSKTRGNLKTACHKNKLARCTISISGRRWGSRPTCHLWLMILRKEEFPSRRKSLSTSKEINNLHTFITLIPTPTGSNTDSMATLSISNNLDMVNTNLAMITILMIIYTTTIMATFKEIGIKPNPRHINTMIYLIKLSRHKFMVTTISKGCNMNISTKLFIQERIVMSTPIIRTICNITTPQWNKVIRVMTKWS